MYKKTSVCKTCHKVFEYIPKNRKGLYCSTKCYHADKERVAPKKSEKHKQNIKNALIKYYKSNPNAKQNKNMKSILMKQNNPMKKVEIAKKAGAAYHQNFLSGKIVHPLIKIRNEDPQRYQKICEQLRENAKKYPIRLRNPVLLRKALRKSWHNKPCTRSEIRVIKLVSTYNLPIEFVGKGDVWYGTKNPDFIVIAQNKVIEVTVDNIPWRIPKKYAKERIKYFWKHYHTYCMVLFVNNMTDDEIVNRLRVFINTIPVSIDAEISLTKIIFPKLHTEEILSIVNNNPSNSIINQIKTPNYLGGST